MFHSIKLTPGSHVDQDTEMFGSHERSLIYRSIIL